MPDIYLFNSLTRKKEKFEAIAPPRVGLYTCGMTVYDYAHIGHGRKYVTDDVLKRLLQTSGYKVKHVQNVTDVGHLVSDADEGEDKLEKGAIRTGKTVWEVADFFTKDFYSSMDKLNIIRPDIICKATDHIADQIKLVGKLVKNGFAYDTSEAVYFDITKFKKYWELFGQRLEEKKVAVRKEVREGEYKKNAFDFALWFKRVGRFADHAMHWDSPWGDGFPGWHIECSAMSMKYLGEQFDIHTGGEDHLSIHHPNEIAQSEATTGKSPFVKYWLHSAFLLVDGRKMSKSLNNFYTVADIEKRGFDPLALRYLYLTAHYRDPLNFTWDSLAAAQSALAKIKNQISDFKDSGRTVLSEEKNRKVDEYREKFAEAIGDDLNTPQTLAVLWEMLKSNIPGEDKYDLALSFDEVLGLQLNKLPEKKQIPEEVKRLLKERESLRKEGKFAEADEIRKQIQDFGLKVSDEKIS
ncbi:cysteine--tRNA ligase [Candidatus Woesebacteria bacterium CG22_combo_CG10-13_8_21_14_all_45_10]|uniref:Cysteine--tRNA ligase n=1 Tax=Candidatus Woesebacteria bacterium CG22_combo_CG10-13_8_21_14_all_45_10 TaxID=1975060 RepID=A0A2H0BHY1_9BACT|nr:MAG: cysteine--tRNA ligase [Candidatus Woesebacteria bacterium CG22_combo_CG10-13_8_21_14_all_45_10]